MEAGLSAGTGTGREAVVKPPSTETEVRVWTSVTRSACCMTSGAACILEREAFAKETGMVMGKKDRLPALETWVADLTEHVTDAKAFFPGAEVRSTPRLSTLWSRPRFG